MLIENCTKYVYQELDELYSKEEWKKKYIVPFGMNTPAKIEINYFLENNIPVAGIADNDKNKQGTSYRNIPVAAPKEILGQHPQDAIILIASSAYQAIENEVIEMGYQTEEIYRLKSFDYEFPSAFSEKIPSKYKEMSLREIQLKVTQVLVYVRDFCKKHQLRYFIAYGSLLGAIRHHGFIPWDDDIDILMPFPDYLKFCELFYKNKDYEMFSMHNPSSNPLCVSTITKVMSCDTLTERRAFPLQIESGIGIDIFPMSGYPNTAAERAKYDMDLKKLGSEWTDKVLIPIGTPSYDAAIHQACYDKLLNFMTQYDYETSAYVGSVHVAPYNHLIAPREYYENTVTVTFEGEEFDAPAGWKELLEMSYGDYMKLPPEDKRKPSHFYHTYKILKSNDKK